MENNNQSDATFVRQKAEELLKKRKNVADCISPTEADTLKLIHELEVHQIELELQYEELQLATIRAEVATKKYIELYDFAPTGYFTLTKEGEIIDLNLYGSQMLGKERSVLKNSRFAFFVSNDSKPHFNLFLEKVFNSKTKESCEVMLIAQGNSPMFVNITGVVTENREQCLVSITDITERMVLEEKLTQSEALLNETEKTGKIGGWTFDVETLTQNWTQETFRILEIDVSKGEPKVPEGISFFAPASQPSVEKTIKRAIEYGEPYDQEWEIITTKGNKRWVHAVAITHQKNGKTISLSGSFQDITERKTTEKAYHETQAILKAALDNSQVGIAIANAPEGKLIYVNDAGLLIRGESRSKIVNGVGIDQYVSSWQIIDFNGLPLNPDEVPLARAIKYGETCSREFIIKRAANDDRIVMASASPIKDDYGNVISGIVVFLDITDRKHAEEKLEANEILLKALNADKDRFISILAHDLKSPFSALLGFSDLLKENLRIYNIDEIEEQVNFINLSARKTFNLLEDILMWAQTQAGKIPFEPKKLNFTDICNQVVEILKPNANTKNITINHYAAAEVTVFADNDMLKTILRNLISNAIKFTNPEGQVNIYAIYSNTNVTITVSDSGIGIPTGIVSRLFDISQNHITNGTAKETGTGLGLLLCKEFVEKHGGKIWVESKEGKGSDFKFSLPITVDNNTLS